MTAGKIPYPPFFFIHHQPARSCPGLIFAKWNKRDDSLKPFQEVRLLTDKYYAEMGINKGDMGYIMEDYDGENFEVEFSDSYNGTRIACFSFPKNELEPTEEEGSSDLATEK
jgi:hypothetical protein